MTIEDKYNNAIELFKNIHLGKPADGQDPNHVRVSNKILRENGLTGSDFWEIICPRLEKEEILSWIPLQHELEF